MHTRGRGLAAEQEQAHRHADPGDVQKIHHRLSNGDDFKTVIYLLPNIENACVDKTIDCHGHVSCVM